MRSATQMRMNLAAVMGLVAASALPTEIHGSDGPRRSRGRGAFIRTAHNGSTFNVGRNAEKRKARTNANTRAVMLGNRRLRQRQGEGYQARA